jgi:glutaryl-CoA dehydrogenase
METRAVRDGDFWILNGEKAWITNGTIAKLAIVWARTDDGVRGFLVETDNPGFSATNVKNKLSLRASVTSNLSFNDCRIPAGNLLAGTEGLKSALSCLNEARFGIAWGAVGAAMSCFETVLDYTKQRVQFDKPIAAFQLTQEKLADMITEITKAQLLCVRLAHLKEEGRATPAQISLAKRNNVKMALDIARQARGMLGAVGITGDLPVFRHMMNLESVFTYEGTHEIHTLTLGRDLTGIAAFS